MFKRTRITLTAWYLLIIMIISMMFSVVIYRMLSSEIERFDRLQRFRLDHRPSSPPENFPLPTPMANPELIAETKQRIFLMLIFVNCGIFVFAGCLGYILAGLTLKPISDMVEEQNRFISDASHELRTPLTSLKSAFEVYLRNRSPAIEEAKTLIRESIDEVNKLQSLSDSLLDLAQYEKPDKKTSYTMVDVSIVLQQAMKKISVAAKHKQIAIQITSANISIEGNMYGLVDLFIILLDNAVKYSPKQSVIRVTVEKDDHSAIVSVIDEGIGIHPHDIPHIFDRFYRADNTRSKIHADGYGLGLSIASKIITMHKGQIHIQSTVGKGSTFTVRLPMRQSFR